MKHGDKKSKAASKAAGKKSSKAGAKSSKAGQVVKGKSQQARGKSDKQTSSKSQAPGDNGKTRPRLTPGDISFSNPLVASAFKRAVKRYPNAFRRLTD